jgi:murein DD-endopeptidase MepM/ murein hydrolase activator NlpD
MTDLRSKLISYLIILLTLFLPSYAFNEVTSPIGKTNVSLELRSQKPGEAFLVKVNSTKEVEQIKGTVFENNLLFYTKEGNENVHYGIGGIRLGTKPGRYPLKINISYKDRSSEEVILFLVVGEKDFGVQHLTVKESYVNLSTSDLQRFKKEKSELTNIFLKVTSEKLFTGNFGMPLTKNIPTTRFGIRRLINGEERKPHTGLDLKGPEGTPVHASNRGRVALAKELFFTGNTIIIDHGVGIYSLYAHLSKSVVKKGELVGKGKLVGYIGETGRVTGPHLHWAFKISGTDIDPVSLIDLNL